MTLEIRSLTKKYRLAKLNATVHALNGIDLVLHKGKTLGIVGESGCGKSTLARLVVGLEPATEGEILWDGAAVKNLAKNPLHTSRTKIQLVFQDPYSSLNPRQRIGESISEVLRVHKLRSEEEIPTRVDELFTLVGLAPDLKHST